MLESELTSIEADLRECLPEQTGGANEAESLCIALMSPIREENRSIELFTSFDCSIFEIGPHI